VGLGLGEDVGRLPDPLIAQFEEQLRVADARKKTRTIGYWAVMVLVLVLGLIFASLLGHSNRVAERMAVQARLEAERESERRILELALVRDEFRLAQTTGGKVVAWGANDYGTSTTKGKPRRARQGLAIDC
jgi:hypothetical protein